MTNHKTKIAVIEPVGGHGGMNYYDFGLLGGLNSAGVAVALYTCDETEIPDNHVHNTYRFFKRIYGHSPKLIRFLRFAIGLLRSLAHARLNGAKLVHFHVFHYTPLEFLEIILTRLFCMRLVLTVHDAESFTSGSSHRIARFVFSNADGIVVHNNVSRQAVLTILPDASKKIIVIPHGNYVDYASTAITREEARRRLGIPLDSNLLLFFGQIKKVKGLDILLRAWKDIPPAIPNSLLLVAGKVWKDDLELYSNLIDQNGIGDSVRLDIRYIPDDEASMYYAAADLIILPYRRIYQSGVLLMAMSHARAVLVSDLPGMIEIIEDGVNGFVFPSENVQELSDTMIRAMRATGLRESIAQRGLQTVSSLHSWHKIGSATNAFYESTCADLTGDK